MISFELLLISRFQTTEIQLKDICDEYLGMSYKKACEAQRVGELPFPVYRLRNSTRSPYLVNVNDFAAYVRSVAKDARTDFETLHEL